MEMIPVPSRVFKQVSTWIMLATALIDAAHLAAASLADLHVVSGQTLALINVALMFFATAAKLVQQNIALTPDEKAAMHDAVAAAPSKGPPPDVPTRPQ